MRFDADELLSALERPSLKIGGRTYTGRLLSFVEFLPLEGLLQKAIAEGWGAPEFKRLILEYCRLAFPRPWWAFWRPRLGRVLLRQPPRIVVEAIKAFFACQKEATRLAAEGSSTGSVEPQPATS